MVHKSNYNFHCNFYINTLFTRMLINLSLFVSHTNVLNIVMDSFSIFFYCFHISYSFPRDIKSEKTMRNWNKIIFWFLFFPWLSLIIFFSFHIKNIKIFSFWEKWGECVVLRKFNKTWFQSSSSLVGKKASLFTVRWR